KSLRPIGSPKRVVCALECSFFRPGHLASNAVGICLSFFAELIIRQEVPQTISRQKTGQNVTRSGAAMIWCMISKCVTIGNRRAARRRRCRCYHEAVVEIALAAGARQRSVAPTTNAATTSGDNQLGPEAPLPKSLLW